MFFARRAIKYKIRQFILTCILAKCEKAENPLATIIIRQIYGCFKNVILTINNGVINLPFC